MKLRTVVEHALENIFGYGDISDLTFGAFCISELW